MKILELKLKKQLINVFKYKLNINKPKSKTIIINSLNNLNKIKFFILFSKAKLLIFIIKKFNIVLIIQIFIIHLANSKTL